jgi:hypothetical protein
MTNGAESGRWLLFSPPGKMPEQCPMVIQLLILGVIIGFHRESYPVTFPVNWVRYHWIRIPVFLVFWWRQTAILRDAPKSSDAILSLRIPEALFGPK